MTYGENSGQLRSALATLLRHHRIQQRLGGRGSYTIPESTTPAQRALLGQQIQRYRYAALAWCLHAVAAADPRSGLGRIPMRNRTPSAELRHRLTRTIDRSGAGVPTLSELTTPQAFAIVECWRQVAKAAVLGEHDFGGIMDHGRLSPAQAKTVLKDAADITRALVVLDFRYRHIPRWVPLPERGWLDLAAQACARFAEHDHPDYSVDAKGWRPPAATIDGDPLPGIGGVLQAEHNMLVHLAAFPTALNLRRVLHSQRVLSHEAAHRASTVAPGLVEKWRQRERTYTKLVAETSDVGGLVGSGGAAASEAANAVSRLRHVHVDETIAPEQLRDLDRLFTRTDARIAALIEQGVAERLYFLNVHVPRKVDRPDGLAMTASVRYVPEPAALSTDLIAIARLQLRPSPVPAAIPPDAALSRDRLRQSMTHRPDPPHGRGR